MPYFQIEDFKAGLDLRRKAYTAPAGTLQELQNAHITPGGEIEKRKAFFDVGNDVSGTYGVQGIGEILYVFNAAAAAGFRSEFVAGTNIQVYFVGLGINIIRVWDNDVYKGRGYVVVEDDANAIRHFYQDSAGSSGWTEVTNFPPEMTGSDRPRHIRTADQRMYGVDKGILWYSKVGDPTNWNDVSGGSGFVPLDSEDAESSNNIGLDVYFGQLAILSNYVTQIWDTSADPSQFDRDQTLRNAGTFSSRSVRQYGNGDVLFLSSSGIRSLYARDSSNSAAVTDIGSPLDPLITDLITQNGTSSDYVANVFALIEPITGRFWMTFEDRVLVLSYFPGPKITAWSEYLPIYDGTGFTIRGGTTIGPIVVLRCDACLRFYGGIDNLTYDASKVRVRTPAMDVQRPASRKQFHSLDAGLECENGAWDVSISYDPNNPQVADLSASLTEMTYSLGTIPLQGISTHLAVTLEHEAAGYALLGNMAIHYKEGEAD